MEKKNVIRDKVYEVGKMYVVRTVTMIDVGKLVSVSEHELVLEDAAWVADTGRWNNFLEKGQYNEAEPFPDGKVIIGRGAVIDACLWDFPPIRVVK